MVEIMDWKQHELLSLFLVGRLEHDLYFPPNSWDDDPI